MFYICVALTDLESVNPSFMLVVNVRKCPLDGVQTLTALPSTLSSSLLN